jgi:hypothetical protein
MTKQAEQIVNVLAKVVPDEGASLQGRHGHAALAAAQNIQGEVAPRLKTNPMYTAAWEEFQQQPEAAAPMLETAIGMLLKTDVALAQRLDSLLNKFREATGESTTVNTGGGAYVGGSVEVTNGDFVGRDKRTTTITGDGNVVGDHSSSSVVKRTGLGVDEVGALFDRAMELARQQPPEVREDLEAAVETVQEETEAGEAADKGLLNKALDVLLEEGPDVLEIVLEAVLNPAAAAGKGARMLAKQAQKSLAKKRKQGPKNRAR